ncbi:MAG: ABC transporter substrate-binding protein [Lachnospiraceae bacterium]|nr:ABC transporter substrate-binding protein [Lachnospiraceae bacterium]
MKHIFTRSRAFAAAAAAVLLLSLTLTACGNNAAGTGASGNNASAEPRDTFTFGIATEVYNLDPFTSTTADARAVYFNIYEGLTEVTTDGQFVPCLASDIEISEDAKTYTFTLRDGVKFHNGNDLTMDDVLWSVQNAIDTGMTGYSAIASFEALSDKELKIELSAPDTGFMACLTCAIVPAGSTDLALSPVGTGPFYMSDYAEQDHLTLSRFDDYWGEKAKLSAVEIRFVANSAELLMAFEGGTIDGFDSSSGVASQLDPDSATLHTRNSNSVQLLALNNARAPFDDIRVRQALSYIVDADEIIETVDYGYGVPVGSALIPGLAVYYNEDMVNYYPTSAEKAKELLAEAGASDLSFTITVPSNYQVHVDTAQVIVNELAAVGVSAKIEQVDWATWLESVYSGRNYEATIISVDGSFAYPTAFLSRYVSDAHNNFVNFNSAEYDEVFKKAVAATDEDEKTALFKEAQAVLTKEAASVFIQDISSINVYSKSFDGFAGYPMYAYDFSVIYATGN